MHLPNSLLSLPLLSTPLTLLLLSLTSPSHSAYTLKDSYTPSTFFSQFTFFTDSDPTNGYVDYISQSAAQSAGLINTNNNQVYMGVDSTNVASGRGRKSVRLTSNAVYNHALIILDLDHMPGSICGVWPAFWTVGPNWPNSGEIDIIEGVNGQVGNSMALHTGAGCSLSGSSSSGNTSPNTGSAQAIFSGTIKTPDCNVAAAGQPTNAGCAITTSDASTYGSGLNNVNGGVYATEWTSSVIRVWFFPRGSIPSDIDSGSPNPNSWGAPLSSFGGGGCTIDNSFKNQQIVFDTTFCGDWAGGVWSSDSMCSGKASTCQDYVQNNPSAFKDAYWAINHLNVYTGDSGNGGAAPSASASQSVPVSMSRSVGSGLPSSQAPIGSASTTPGFSTGAPKPVPVPTGSSTTTTRGQFTAATSTRAGTFVPPVATSPAAVPQPSAPPAQSQSQVPANPNPSANPNPTPIPAAPTTMATSGTNNWGGNSNSNTWGGNNNGNSWGNGNGYTRGWNRPPRMGRRAAGPPAAVEMRDINLDIDVREEGSVNVSEGAGLGAVRNLIRPVVRQMGDAEVMGEEQKERRDVKRSHLGRHKERRWGHEHAYGLQ